MCWPIIRTGAPSADRSVTAPVLRIHLYDARVGRPHLAIDAIRVVGVDA
jgi:hypothetical protein